MATAKTPKGRKVQVEITAEHGEISNRMGRVTFEGVRVACWSEGSSGIKTLKEALERADESIDQNELQSE